MVHLVEVQVRVTVLLPAPAQVPATAHRQEVQARRLVVETAQVAVLQEVAQEVVLVVDQEVVLVVDQVTEDKET